MEHEAKQIASNRNATLRYCGVGLSFPKPSIFQAGARSVLYEKYDVARAMLHKDEWWRIVTYQFNELDDGRLNIVDWTHEREWRFPGDFEFTNYAEVQIILYDSECYRYFLSKCPESILKEIAGLTILRSVNM